MEDPFESITMLDADSTQQGFIEGVGAGKKVGILEGRELGIKRGKDFGNEIGYYYGFSQFLLFNLEKIEGPTKSQLKIIYSLQCLISSINKIRNNSHISPDIVDNLVKIRTDFKRIHSSLKLKHGSIQTDKTSLSF